MIRLERQVAYAFSCAIFYGVCSGSMNFTNKWVLNTWGFNYPNFMVFCQLALFSFVITALRKTGKITDHVCLAYTRERGRQLALLSFLYLTNVILALFALSGMNIPMYNAMRRCVPIASLLLGPVIYPQRTTPQIIGAIILITAGTITAATGDLDFDFKSYMFGAASVLSQSLYLLTLQKMGSENQLDSYNPNAKAANAMTILYVNSVNCLPVTAIVVVLSGELHSMQTYAKWHEPGFIIALVLTTAFACVFSYSIFLCTTVNSALTTACVGVIKSALTTIIGMYTFGGVAATPLLIIGQLINLSGGSIYTWEKYRIQQKRQQQAQAAPAPTEPSSA